MMVVNRFQVSDPEQFRTDAEAALRALSACQGFVDGQCGTSVDEPQHWVLVTRWESVGAYRRALGSFDVKMYGTPLLAQALPEASAFEVRLAATPDGLDAFASDRAAQPWRSTTATRDDDDGATTR